MSVVKSLFGKVTEEIPEFCNSVGNSFTCIGILLKVAPQEILRNFLLTGVVGLQSTGCNTTKNELLTKFLKDVLKILENFQGELCDWVLF